jgi:hypothetical protein
MSLLVSIEVTFRVCVQLPRQSGVPAASASAMQRPVVRISAPPVEHVSSQAPAVAINWGNFSCPTFRCPRCVAMNHILHLLTTPCHVRLLSRPTKCCLELPFTRHHFPSVCGIHRRPIQIHSICIFELLLRPSFQPQFLMLLSLFSQQAFMFWILSLFYQYTDAFVMHYGTDTIPFIYTIISIPFAN